MKHLIVVFVLLSTLGHHWLTAIPVSELETLKLLSEQIALQQKIIQSLTNKIDSHDNISLISTQSILGSTLPSITSTTGKLQQGFNLINLIGHTGDVNTLIKLSNDNLLASGSDDNTIKIWNLKTNSLIRTLSGSSGHVLSLAVLNNGYLASGSADKSIQIWNAETGQQIRKLNGHLGEVKSLAVLNNGMLASGSLDQSIKIWNTDFEQCSNFCVFRTIKAHKDSVLCLYALKNGNLASGGGNLDPTIKIWNINYEDGLIKTFTGHYAAILTLVQIQNGNLISGSADKTIKIWDMLSGNVLRTLVGHTNLVNDLAALYPNGGPNGYLASCSDDANVRIWDLASTKNAVWTLPLHQEPIKSLTILKNGYIVSASTDNTIKLWDMAGFLATLAN